uniref:Uncharacterized protein n=1 Tax=Arundo donax TaxID=35708 RepID=A0A0A9GDY9_ARUDO
MPMPFAAQPHGTGGGSLRRASPPPPAAALRLGPLFWPWEKVKVGPLSVPPWVLEHGHGEISYSGAIKKAWTMNFRSASF